MLRRESSTLSSIRPELMAEGRPKGEAEGKGKASPLEAGRDKYSSEANNRAVFLQDRKQVW